ncbi:sugar transporter ERD6-like 7 [Populus alba x Populus x berolinensis]|nr:sugar transporter ERD6-like 7 [Populus alba x Populus x berolinensis]
MVGIGVSVAFITGTVLTWRVLELTGLIPCVILLVGLSLFPESPRWLAKKGREKEFESTLQKLRGKAVDSSSYEAAEIKIVVGLMVLQQLGGTNAFCFYASHTFESAGFSPSVEP